MKRIYVTAFTAKNLGDDLFVKVLCERYPGDHFYIDCFDSHDTAFRGIPNLTVLNRANAKGKWMERLQKYAGKMGFAVDFAYDAQIYIGGSIFIEFQNPVTYEGYFSHLYSSKICQNIPYFVIGANFGPYQTEGFVEKHKEFFRYQITDLCMRDQSSYRLFRELPQVRYAPDILCTCKLPVREKKNLILISCIFNEVREEIFPFDNEEYEKKMAELCEYYLGLGKKVCLLSMCSQQKDQEMCHRIAEHFHEDVNVAEYDGNIEEVMELFASAEYIIASRFHAMILGWLSKAPVFPICYSDKTLNVIRDYGFQGDYAPIDGFPGLSCSQIDRNRSNHYLFDTAGLEAEAQKQFLKLDEFMAEEKT